ncbi:hypothetical protein B0H14DRAFT_2670475 [Mycena olivaceomarginata]|nr:hypothetical protein B0H14DRAFT_2670475 [Mycena olivaceomarginata]
MLAAPPSAALHLCLLLATAARTLDCTTEQGGAAITGLWLFSSFFPRLGHFLPLTPPRIYPSAECTPYHYPSVTAGQFSPI